MILIWDNLIKFAQSIATLAVFVAALEILLRMVGIAYPPRTLIDPILGVIYYPGATFSFREEGYANVQINQEGVRDVDWPVPKPADEIRIAVLGDSYIEATQVPVEARVTEQLAELLSREKIFADKKVRVMNFGMAGFGTGQEYLLLRERVAKYRPDLVVLAFLSGNDFSDNCRALRPHKQRPFFDVHDGQLVVDNSFARNRSWRDEIPRELASASRILQITYEAKRVVRELRGWTPRSTDKPGVPRQIGLNEYIYFPPQTAAWCQAWKITEALLLAIADETRAIGAKLLVVLLPNDDQMHPDPAKRQQFAGHLGVESLDYPNQQIASFCEQHGLAVLDLLPPMLAYGESHHVFLHGFENGELGRGHWNQAGHRVGAELIAKKISELRATIADTPSNTGGTAH